VFDVVGRVHLQQRIADEISRDTNPSTRTKVESTDATLRQGGGWTRVGFDFRAAVVRRCWTVRFRLQHDARRGAAEDSRQDAANEEVNRALVRPHTA
jgi:hypothetical protein